MHILLVADEAWVLEDVRAALGETRFRLSTTDDPHAIADTCREIEPDAVIADLQVGTKGGMAVVRSIRSAVDAGTIPPTPTILLLDRGADAFIARRAGADAALRKPFGAFELRDLLDRLAGEAVGADSP